LRRTEADDVIPPEDGVYADISDTDYHSDKDSLSSSGARTLLWSSPEKFEAEQRKPPNPKPEYDFGHVAHRLILGKGSDVVIVDAETWRGSEARQAQEDAWATGQVPILAKNHETAKLMAARVREHPTAGALLAVGDAEVSGWWHDEATDARLRWRADWLHPGRSRLIIVDYKTAKDASPAGFSKSIGEYRYHQQDGWYRDGVIANDLDADPLFLFIAQEKTAPYAVSVHEIPPDALDRGRALNRKAIDIYAQCRRTGQWPGYGDSIHTAEIPAYTRYREEALLA
jgi:hypothetical protein